MMNFEALVQALVDAGVEFVIIGGWSAILQGSAYTTEDLDICFARTSENLRRLARALASYHPRPAGMPKDLPFVWDEVTMRNGTVFTLDTDVGRIDLLAEVSGVGTFDDMKSTAVNTEAFERRVRVLDLKSLIKAKRAAGREKDLRILPELEALLEAQEP
jgi:predicted nucleotidyltransferase